MLNIINKTIHFTGEINGDSINLLESSILSYKSLSKNQKEKGILISLKNLIYTNKISVFSKLVQVIARIGKSIGLQISFIDYTMELFPHLKKSILATEIKLFKNSEVANLFLDPDSFTKSMSVLIYDEDAKNAQDLWLVLKNSGHKIVVAQDLEEFLDGIKLKKYDIIVSRSVFNGDVKAIPKFKEAFSLSKQVIVNLPTFINKSAETLVSFTGLEAKKLSHKIQQFDPDINEEMISAVMYFHGDLEGYFTLLFPKDIAVLSIGKLLGETIQFDDLDALKDGVGEFCNIITGAAKTDFDTIDVRVIFELPRTCDSLKETETYVGNNAGVWINMELSKKPFYIFIS